ncbi:hypothetical protein ACWEQ4_01485 [Rhodococcus sp. NPDC003994]
MSRASLGDWFRRVRELPPHIAEPDHPSSLVGPLITFRGKQVSVPHSPPRNTLDPRYKTCTDHHLACHCREAEQNEQLHEYRAEWRKAEETLAVILEGHPTWVYDLGDERRDLQCTCTGCKFARANGFLIKSYRSPNHVTIRPATPF